MMLQSPRFHFDVASAISQGRRDYQEDAIVTDFPLGADIGFAVLADGMGGHSAGDVASKIAVTEVFSELKLQSGDQIEFEKHVPDVLLEAARAANECMLGHVKANPDTRGMGSTLVAPVLIKDQLYWLSIGDSPLFLFRDGELVQLNEDHSLAPQIDHMVETGLLSKAAGQEHPDRNCLTSVLIGDEIARIDCPAEPISVKHGDILIVASDGLQFLTNDQIETVVSDNLSTSGSVIAKALMAKLKELDDPDQDNTSFCVIKVMDQTKSIAVPELECAASLNAAVPETPTLFQSSAPVTASIAELNPIKALWKRSVFKDGWL